MQMLRVASVRRNTPEQLLAVLRRKQSSQWEYIQCPPVPNSSLQCMQPPPQGNVRIHTLGPPAEESLSCHEHLCRKVSGESRRGSGA